MTRLVKLALFALLAAPMTLVLTACECGCQNG
jgi:hypothetical protein